MEKPYQPPLVTSAVWQSWAAWLASAVLLASAMVWPGALRAQSADQLSEQVKQFVSVDAPVVALTGVTVIDGTGGPPQRSQTVVIDRGRIAALGPADEVDVPAGAEVMELPGHTVIPGMVGLHNHMFFMGAGGRSAQGTVTSPRLYLAAGVTTIRTTGSISPYADINLKANIDGGSAPGPRIHITAPYITGPGGVSDMAQVDTPEQARRFVRYWANEGATWIKAYTDIRRAELAAVIDEAHAQGIKVTGHICSITFQEAVDLGIDNIEHGFDTATDFDARKQPDECPPNSMVVIGRDGDPSGDTARAVILKMVEAGVGMTSTMAVIEPFVKGRKVMDERTLEAMAPEVREDYVRFVEDNIEGNPNWPFTMDHLEKSMAFERGFVEAGGVLAAGVDPTGIGGAIAGFGDQRNYQLLIEAGFSAPKVVQVMSANGAKILGVDGDLGTIETGKLADIVVLDGDLASDSEVIRNVAIVFKDGVGYDSAKLIESVKGRVGIN